MINIRSLFFILFLLLITGGSAALAKNDYGVTLMAISFFGYALSSLIYGFLSIFERRKKITQITEYFALMVVFSIIGMRIILIRFPYVELLFSTAALTLVMVYLQQVTELIKSTNKKPLTYLLLFLYSSIVIYLVAMAIGPISSYFSELISVIGFILFVFAVATSFRIRTIAVQDKEISLSQYLNKLPNHSIVIISLMVMYTLYSAAVVSNIMPSIHSNNMPKGYYELIEKAELGEDVPVNGEYKYQSFKAYLDKFYDNQGMKD